MLSRGQVLLCLDVGGPRSVCYDGRAWQRGRVVHSLFFLSAAAN
ncbi:unnamed protein product [Amoebophrya sp. A120]|nr:unnamed protein product [Amoebophrya sp. A120]|eukprot:GSA120T00017956001.1